MSKSKYQRISDELYLMIMSGEYKTGSQIPTEQELTEKFQTSRPTISRALNELEKRGLIQRTRGKGSFVRQSSQIRGNTLGLLTPEIWAVSSNSDRFPSPYTPLMSGLTHTASKYGYSLLLSSSPSNKNDDIIEQATTVCEHLIHLQVKGVFFMPLILPEEQIEINQKIAESFADAGIAVLLLNYDLSLDIKRSHYDRVGINNIQASFELTEHLIRQGCKKIDFVAGFVNCPTVQDRVAGYKYALEHYGIKVDPKRIHYSDIDPFYNIDPQIETKTAEKLIKQSKSDAIVCVNDGIAACLIRNFLDMGINVPKDIRVVGFDDSPFVSYLQPPLTTIRQPLNALADEAVRVIISRIENPDLPPRDVKITADLIIRKSCGAVGNKKTQKH